MSLVKAVVTLGSVLSCVQAATSSPSVIPTIAPTTIYSLPFRVATIVGTGTQGSLGDGGPATAARLDSVRSAMPDTLGNIYVCDTANFVIRKVSTFTNIINTIVGTLGSSSSTGDGGAMTSAKLGAVYHFWYQGFQGYSTSTDLYLADYSIQEVRKASLTTGLLTVFAGQNNLAISGTANGDGGQATSGKLLHKNNLILLLF